MLGFVLDNLGTIIVLVIVILIIIAAILKLKKDKKSGNSCGSCGSCNACYVQSKGNTSKRLCVHHAVKFFAKLGNFYDNIR